MRLVALTLACLLATGIADAGPLPRGKPAGVRPAVTQTQELYVFVLAGMAAGGLGLLMLGKHGGGISLSNLSATATSP